MDSSLQITIDCADPAPLVRFWAAALGYVPSPPPPGHRTWRDYYLSIGETEDSLGEGDACDVLIDPSGCGPRLWFQVVPEPKTVKNRVHLDLITGRLYPGSRPQESVPRHRDRLLALGGTVLRDVPDRPGAHYACLMADPEGNELCLV